MSAVASLDARPLQADAHIEEITTERGLADIADEWNALSERSATALLFNSHEWVSACWKHFHSQAGQTQTLLWVLALREAGVLAAVAPLWIETRWRQGLRLRTARWIGEGPSDYGDLLLLRLDPALVDAIVSHIVRPGSPCHLVDLRECRGDSPALRWLRAALQGHASMVQESSDNVCFSINTACSWDAYFLGQFRGKRRRDFLREWRNLSEAGGFEWEMIDALPAVSDAASAFGAVQASHVAAGEMRPGEFNDPVFRPFLEEVLVTASRRRSLRACVMKRHGQTVAYYLVFAYRGRHYVYNTAHTAQCQALGAGKLLMLYMLEKLFQEGEGTIDFLRGAESYKEMLTDQSTTNLRLKAARRDAAGHVVGFLALRLLPGLERRLPRLHRLLTVTKTGLRELGRRLLTRLAARARS